MQFTQFISNLKLLLQKDLWAHYVLENKKDEDIDKLLNIRLRKLLMR